MPVASADNKPANTQCRKGRWYWEPPAKLKRDLGLKSHPLGEEQSAAWAMARKLNDELEVLRRGDKVPGTVIWMFSQFFETEKFNGLARSTQIDYRWLAKCLCAVPIGARTLGDITAMAIRPSHADFIHDAILVERGHSTAHYCARFARRVWKWAARKEHVGPHNPWAAMELKGLAERDQYWLPEQVAAFIQAAEESKYPSIALAARIAYAFGHRKGDILTLTWTALESEIRTTSKTKVKLPVVLSSYPDLEAAVEAERARQKATGTPSTHVIQCELNKGVWHPDVFAHKFREIAKAAGIPADLQFRDLRATVQTELSNAGATVIDMSTHSGHKTVTMARRYARRTPEQFQRAAALRQAAREQKNKEENASELPSELRNCAEND